MSVLETPRIYFQGQATWDPIVTNNYDTFYDETDAETIFPAAVKKVAAFRAEAIAAVGGGNWNPHGTHRATFFDSAISGADLGAGAVANDPFVGSPADFMGMLVDVEPYGAYSSQLFFNTMRFGIDGGYRIAAKRGTRFTARYLNFSRNTVGAIAGIASIVWQTSFATDDLRIDAFDSPALHALERALGDAGVLGLTVQWNAYRTIYYDNPGAADEATMDTLKAELTAKLNGGGFQPNPARSMVVGVIGVWRKGEPVHEPGDRVLLPGPHDPPKAPNAGTVHARVTSDAITLDLSNSISETGLDLTKKDFGTLSVVAVDEHGTPSTLATLDYTHYDKAAYERTSGIVTLPHAYGSATASNLQIRDAAGNVLLQESELRAVPLVPNLYMNEGETETATFQVYSRGAAAGAGIAVTICVMSADGRTIKSTFPLTTAADGTVSFPLDGAIAGVIGYVALPGPNPLLPPKGINPQVHTYMYVRTLPADDAVARLAPTWEHVYGRVLSNWHAMAPCMDNWLDLGDEAQVRSFAPMIKKLTSPASFENFRYMPVTRDLTPGARTLLYNFLDSPPAPPAAKMMTAENDADAPVNFADLSRKMRA
jgi:hypothetical protein